MDILKLIGRSKELLTTDINKNEAFLSEEVQKSSFIVIGGAGSIGQAVTKEIFIRNPKNYML
jgi:UDP-N-acetylglucosamine 4,6-dehydratase